MENNEMEIPFGAKDSELIESTYHIPDGMEAIIEDDKVIIRKKESEDERIRKGIIDVVKGNMPDNDYRKKYLDWLEKQGQDNIIEALRLEYEKGKSDVLQEQRKEWSEEDERIRKAIISIIQNSGYMSKEFKEKVFSWLEKQGEQKVPVIDFKAKDWYVSKVDGKIRNIYHSVDKVEPKFKVGDWIVNNNSGYVYQVTEIRDDEYCLWPLDAEIKGYLRIIDVDNDYHLWSIQDAKDGDIIYIKRHKNNSEWLLIFKEIKSQNALIDVYDYYAYSITTNNAYHQGFCRLWGLLLDDEIVCPATKEQCNLLFAKIKEAGYEWDVEKKELKKIDWSKDDERILTNLIDYFNIDDCLLYSVEQIIDWFKSLKERIKNVKNR